jgi:hypothetical protein
MGRPLQDSRAALLPWLRRVALSGAPPASSCTAGELDVLDAKHRLKGLVDLSPSTGGWRGGLAKAVIAVGGVTAPPAAIPAWIRHQSLLDSRRPELVIGLRGVSLNGASAQGLIGSAHAPLRAVSDRGVGRKRRALGQSSSRLLLCCP